MPPSCCGDQGFIGLWSRHQLTNLGETRSSEEGSQLEADGDDNSQGHHEEDGDAHGAAVPRAAHHKLQLLVCSAHAVVSHINILIQVIQQPLMQVKLLVHRQCNVLRTPAPSRSCRQLLSLLNRSNLQERLQLKQAKA